MSAVPVEQLDELRAYAEDVSGCTRCRLAEGRTQVVFGSGDPNADLMFVGEAPGFHEDRQGVPFVGQAAALAEVDAPRARVGDLQHAAESEICTSRTVCPRPQPSARRPRLAPVTGAVERASALQSYADETAGCLRCALSAGRTQVVFGAGNPDADLMFVGEAPGFHEDKQGVPFVGQAGKLLEKLLAQIGLARSDVYIANVIMCRPPGNRDPQADEIEACESHLFRQMALIEPTVVATLGNFATKLLSGRQLGITKVHGQEQKTTIGGRDVLLYPLYHPAAALYTPAMLKVLESDFARLPELLGRSVAPPAPVEPELTLVAGAPVEQLGLF